MEKSKDAGGDEGPTNDADLREEMAERRRAERQLRESEDRFHETFENAAVGIAHVGPDGRWLRVNERLCSITGYSRAELLERTFQQITHPDDLQGDMDFVGQMLEGRIQTYAMEKRYIRKSGEHIWINLTVSLIRDAAGQGDYFISVVEDIDSRKRAERERDDLFNQLRAINNELESRVSARTAELRATLKEREVLLQEVHHRVKNNLQVISSLINMQARQVVDATALGALEACQLRVNAIALIHEKLYQSPNHASIPFGDYAQSLATSVFNADAVAAERVDLILEVADVTLSVSKAIPAGLIISELISNALKHAFPGQRRGSIRVVVGKVDDQLVLMVSDDGVGMPAGLEPTRAASVGMELITTLVEQLEGSLEMVTGDGTAVTVRTPWEAIS